MGFGAAVIVTLTVAVSAVDPETPDVSAPTVTAQVPVAAPVTVKDDPDACHPDGVAVQVASAD